MGRKKKKHIYLYNPEVQKKIEELRELFPDKTYDEIFDQHLILPTTNELLKKQFDEIIDMMMQKYKEPRLRELKECIWVLLIMSARGEYDIVKLLYNLNADIDKKIYRKR